MSAETLTPKASGRNNFEAPDSCWWLAPDSDRPRMAQAWTARHWRNLDDMRQRMLTNARLYGNMPLAGLTPKSYRSTSSLVKTNQLSLNVVKAVCDSYVALLTDEKPKVTFLTTGGDWKTQKKAKALEKFVDGVFYEAELYDSADLIALDSAVFGTAVVKNYVDEDEKQICIERVFPWEIVVDDEEAMRGKPTTIGHVTWVDRRALMAAYPELAEKIRFANTSWMSAEAVATDVEQGNTQVALIELWHLGKGGMHIMQVGDVELVAEKYTKKKSPLEFLYRLKPLAGIWGISLADELRGIQKEINTILLKIQRSYHLLAAGHWLVEEGSDIDTGELDNVIGSIIRYRGTRPEMTAASGVPADVYQQLDRLYNRAFEIIGVPATFAQGQKPADLSSGKAMQTYADISAKRFTPSYRQYQGFFMRESRQVLDLARDVPNMKVKVSQKDFMQTVKSADVIMKEDEFVLQMYPTNKLASDPAEKLSQVQELANAGWIPPEKAMRLLDFPDLDSFAADANASYDLVQDIANDLLDGGEYVGPEPFMNLTEAVDIMQRCYLRAKQQGAKPKQLTPLLRWMNQAAGQLAPPPQQANAGAPTAGIAQNLLPPGVTPMPPPGGAPPPSPIAA